KTLSGLGAPDANHPFEANHALAVFVTAGVLNAPDPSIPGSQPFSAMATIGFVQGSLTPIAGMTNGLNLTVLVDHLATAPTVKMVGAAGINMTLAGNFAGVGDTFPGIDVDLHVNWTFDTNNPSANAPQVSFDNVSLDLGSFLSKMVQPVLQYIQLATAPLEP